MYNILHQGWCIRQKLHFQSSLMNYIHHTGKKPDYSTSHQANRLLAGFLMLEQLPPSL